MEIKTFRRFFEMFEGYPALLIVTDIDTGLEYEYEGEARQDVFYWSHGDDDITGFEYDCETATLKVWMRLESYDEYDRRT